VKIETQDRLLFNKNSMLALNKVGCQLPFRCGKATTVGIPAMHHIGVVRHGPARTDLSEKQPEIRGQRYLSPDYLAHDLGSQPLTVSEVSTEAVAAGVM
jgi:hypothetical protein